MVITIVVVALFTAIEVSIIEFESTTIDNSNYKAIKKTELIYSVK